eukprot:2459063-Pyramimonas_sp.AAC.1
MQTYIAQLHQHRQACAATAELQAECMHRDQHQLSAAQTPIGAQGQFLQQLCNVQQVIETQLQQRPRQLEDARSEIHAMQKEREADF